MIKNNPLPELINPFAFRFSSEFFNRIPNQCGVYWMMDSRRNILYVGSAINLQVELRTFKDLKMRNIPQTLGDLISRVHQIDWSLSETIATAKSMKVLLVKQCHPPFNHSSKKTKRTKDFYFLLTPRSGKLEISIVPNNNTFSENIYGPFSNKIELQKIYSSIVRWMWLITGKQHPTLIPPILTKPIIANGFQIEIIRSHFNNHNLIQSLHRYLKGHSTLFIDFGIRILEQHNEGLKTTPVLKQLFHSDIVALETFFQKRARKFNKICPSTLSLAEQRIN